MVTHSYLFLNIIFKKIYILKKMKKNINWYTEVCLLVFGAWQHALSTSTVLALALTHLILIVNHNQLASQRHWTKTSSVTFSGGGEPIESVPKLGHGGGVYFSRISALSYQIVHFQVRHFSDSVSERPLTNPPCILPERSPWCCHHGRFRQGISPFFVSLLLICAGIVSAT